MDDFTKIDCVLEIIQLNEINSPVPSSIVREFLESQSSLSVAHMKIDSDN